MQVRPGLLWLLGLAIVPSMAAQGKLSIGPAMAETFKFDLNIPEGNFNGYPGLMSSNTTFLLEQAENMLSKVQVYRERLWLQAFLLKMRQLATNVKKSTIGNKDKEHNNIQKKNDASGGHDGTIQKKNDGSGGHDGIIQKKNDASGGHDGTIQKKNGGSDGHEDELKENEESIKSSFEQSTQQKFESIIRSIEISSASTTNRPEMTSNDQTTFPKEQKTVNMQQLMSTPGQHHKNELAWELGEFPRLAALERRRRKAVKPNFLMAAYEAANEIEKRKIEMELGKEILELKQRGSSPYEIELALRLDEPMTVKLLHPYIHQLKMKMHGHSVKKTMAHQRKTKQPLSTSIAKKQINLFPIKEHMEHKHPRLQNILRKLQRENYFLKQSLNAFRNGNLNNGFMSRIGESPNLYPSIPYNTQLDFHTSKNAEFDDMKNKSIPYNSDFLPQRGSSTNKNEEFSEEMKKELNNGKVILLSHSVVPSNFETGYVVPTKSDIKIEVPN